MKKVIFTLMLIYWSFPAISQGNKQYQEEKTYSRFHLGVGYSNFLEAGMDVFPETGPDILRKSSALNHGITVSFLWYNWDFTSAIEFELGYYKERYGEYVQPRFDKLTALLNPVNHTFEFDTKFTSESTFLVKANLKRWHYLSLSERKNLRIGYGVSLQLLPEEMPEPAFIFNSDKKESYVIICKYDHNWTSKRLNKGVYFGAGYQKYLWGRASYNIDFGYYFYPMPYTYGEYSTAGAFPFEATGTMIHEPGHFQIDVSILF